jgi:hypothetical protein
MISVSTEIKHQIKRVLRLKENEALFSIGSEKEIQDQIVELNTYGQLFKGVDSEGKELVNSENKRTTYTPFSQRLKAIRFPAGFPTHYTLLDSGAYYDSFKVKATKKGYIEINSQPKKKDGDLFQKFGAEIEGLNDKSLSLLQEDVLVFLLAYTKTQIGL